MKRLPHYLTLFILLFYFPATAADIYVAPNGSDNNEGSINKPFATLHMALRKARELRRLNDPSVQGGIHIILSGGLYTLEEPVLIRPEDGGSTTSITYIEAAKNEKPVLSGGVHMRGWRKTSINTAGLSPQAKGKLWVADVPMIGGQLFLFRQLWVNDRKAIRAKSSNGSSMQRILNWNKQDQTCWIPTPKFASLQKEQGLEFFIHQWWAIANLRVKKMEAHGDSTKLFFHQPESRIQSEHPWPAPWLSQETGNSAFYLTNAIQFLDEPGEWYLDVKNQKLYYWPRAAENMQTSEIVAPHLETLVKIEGTSTHSVSNIVFSGIAFQHTGWLRPSLQGHVPHQAGMYMTDAYKLRPAGTAEKKGLDNQAWVGRPAATVTVSYSNNTTFKSCSFTHLASTGLDYGKGNRQATIDGNLFKDIGGAGMVLGHFSDEGLEIHKAYDPSVKNPSEITEHLSISNNLITNVTNEDWSCTGIEAGYVRSTQVFNNEIEQVSYSGISMGWGWSPAENVMSGNKIFRNKIHHYGKTNYDCAGIYTLSAQNESAIYENYIDSIYKSPFAHLPSHWFYIYCDEGSSGFTVKDNWTPSQKFLQNANGPNNEWTNNGPAVDDKIKSAAGIKPEYAWLYKEKTVADPAFAINEEHNEVIEIVTKENETLDLQKLKTLLAQNKMDSSAVFQWNNHYVIYSKVADLGVMQGRLQNNFPNTTVKAYHDMFYQYDRKKHCPAGTVAKEWDHVILTANLVADTKLQKEYLAYHATQFQKWPELSKGFCNAQFQQLNIFKSGRQLVLVISIPKGASLDALNPKTTENNPRVIEWNNLMKKYQEGIEGTKKGETWVFLRQL